MSPRSHQTITKHLASLTDPRTGNALQHQLQDILIIAICASICCADTWTDAETWGIAKHDWLRGFLELPHGILSHDTFGRVFALLDPDEFRKGFLSWIRAIQKLTRRQVIALDGKKLRRSHDHRLGQKSHCDGECVGNGESSRARSGQSARNRMKSPQSPNSHACWKYADASSRLMPSVVSPKLRQKS